MKPESKKFLDDIQSQHEDVQLAAWTNAGETSSEVIPPLCELLVSEDMKIAKAADEALKQITHSVGRELAGRRWKSVVNGYIKVLRGEYPDWSKGIALRHLSLVAHQSSVRRIAKLLKNEAVREEAVFCLERIPGERATAALAKELKNAPEDFKTRILEALAHRGDRAALRTVAKAYKSGRGATLVAAGRAMAGVGAKPKDWKTPPVSDLNRVQTPTERRKLIDSFLRYSDKMADTGEPGEWLAWYHYCLESASEEHLRCAGIVGLCKYAKKAGGGDARRDAVRRIEKKLSDESYIVRITAQKAMDAL